MQRLLFCVAGELQFARDNAFHAHWRARSASDLVFGMSGWIVFPVSPVRWASLDNLG